MKGNNTLILCDVDMRDAVEKGLRPMFSEPIIVQKITVKKDTPGVDLFEIEIARGPIVE